MSRLCFNRSHNKQAFILHVIFFSNKEVPISLTQAYVFRAATILIYEI